MLVRLALDLGAKGFNRLDELGDDESLGPRRRRGLRVRGRRPRWSAERHGRRGGVCEGKSVKRLPEYFISEPI